MKYLNGTRSPFKPTLFSFCHCLYVCLFVCLFASTHCFCVVFLFALKLSLHMVLNMFTTNMSTCLFCPELTITSPVVVVSLTSALGFAFYYCFCFVFCFCLCFFFICCYLLKLKTVASLATFVGYQVLLYGIPIARVSKSPPITNRNGLCA